MSDDPRNRIVVTIGEWRAMRAERDALAERVERLRGVLERYAEGRGSKWWARDALRADDEAAGR